MSASFEAATKAQYDDDTNLAARQALFDWLTAATPLPAPLSDMSSLAGTRVLDLGCGNGRFLANAQAAGAFAVGSDLSFGMLESARALTDAPILQANAHLLPFADDVVDVVLALWMIYHLEDKPAALAEIARVLAPGGQLVASTNSGGVGRLDAMIIDALAVQLGRRVEHWHSPLTFTSADGAAILRSAFRVVEAHPFGNTFTVADADVLVRYVGSMLWPIREEHGPIDEAALLAAIGRAAHAEIEQFGSVVIERTGAVFIATV